MQKTNFGYIYCTTNNVNGKVYIGQRKGKFYRRYFGSGDNIIKAVSKYGECSFSVMLLVYCCSAEELDQVEIKLIARYREALGWDNVYNIEDGGSRFKKGERRSAERSDKIKRNRVYGKPSKSSLLKAKKTRENNLNPRKVRVSSAEEREEIVKKHEYDWSVRRFEKLFGRERSNIIRRRQISLDYLSRTGIFVEDLRLASSFR